MIFVTSIRRSAAWATLAVAGLLTGPQLNAANPEEAWNRFQNGGQLIETELPASWDASGTNIAWQAKVTGYGQSSPVVHKDQVVVTSTSGSQKDNYHVAAYSVSDGQQLWKVDFANPSPVESNNYVSRAAPTPVVDKDGVVASFEGGIVVALDHQGKTRWQKNLVTEFGAITSRHGLAASLEQDDKRVFVWIERDKEPYIVALEKATGNVAWKAEGLGATSWSSPRLLTVAGKPHLVCSASGRLAGYDPSTGQRLWQFTEVSNNTTCTPIPVGDGRFVIGASDGRGEQEASGKAAESNGVIEIKPQPDGTFNVAYVWRAKKATSSFGSPIVAGNCVWIVNRVGVLYKLDAATGQEVSAERIKAGSVWATPLATADKLYLFGQKGTTSIVNLSDSKELATCTLWESNQEAAANGGQVLYGVAVAGKQLLIRRGDTLFAVKQK